MDIMERIAELEKTVQQLKKEAQRIEEQTKKAEAEAKALEKLIPINRDNSAEPPKPKKIIKITYNPREFEIDGTTLVEYFGKSSTVTIPNGIKVIGSGALGGNKNITKVILPDTVTKIGDSAFKHCESLKEINIPDSVTEIGNSAFERCNSLERIRLSDNVKKIGKDAFWSCDELRISVPGNCNCGSSAFYSCANVAYRGK